MGKLGLSLLILLAIVACRREEVRVLNLPYYVANESVKSNIKLDSADEYVVPFEDKDYADYTKYVIGSFKLQSKLFGERYMLLEQYSQLEREVVVEKPQHYEGNFEYQGVVYPHVIRSVVYKKYMSNSIQLNIIKLEKLQYELNKIKYDTLYHGTYTRSF